MVANPMVQYDPFPHIPSELKNLPNWCVWQYQITPYGRTKVPRNPISHTHKADSTDPSTWVSYEIALANLQGYEGLGFFFSKSAGYTGVDLDDPFSRKDKSVIQPGDPDYEAAAKTSEQHGRIYNACQSYAELSPSGKGAHIIVKGSIPRGVKSPIKKVEMYDEARFFTMTGRTIRIAPIFEEQEFLTELFVSIGKLKDAEGFDPADKPEVDDDETIYNRASNAINGDKFLKLWAGNSDGYPSDSEAHQALMNIIAFYTDNFAQCKRMFSFSKMSAHPKASRPKYLDLTVKRAFDQKPPTIEALTNMSNDFNALLQRQREAAGSTLTDEPSKLAQPAAQVQEGKGNNLPALEDQSHVNKLKSTPLHLLKPPPGLLGEVAQYIYHSAPLPVPQIALAGAIGFLSGMIGKAFNISGSGLNHYVLLLAETGRGKEGMRSGIRRLVASMEMSVPTIRDVIGPGKINSGQSLGPYLADHPTKCFVSIQSEFDSAYAQMIAKNASSAMTSLKSAYLDLYMASGKDQTVDSSIYSDRKKTINVVKSPSFSLLGECTITHMNRILNEDQISDGLLTRFINIVYDGEQVPFNEGHGQAPDINLVNRLCYLFHAAQTKIAQQQVIQINMDEAAEKRFKDLREVFRSRVNDKSKPHFTSLWNRAWLKAVKLAALVAASDCPHAAYIPTINIEAAEWAISLVEYDVFNIISRFEQHEVGEQSNDLAQLRDVKKAIGSFYTLTANQKKTYRISDKMWGDEIISYFMIHNKTAGYQSLKDDRNGHGKALDKILKILCDLGVLYDLNNDKKYMKDNYLTTQRAYKVLLKGECL